MKIRDILEQKKRTISFEFFPPKTPEAEKTLLETISLLKPLCPSFVSVTYGAMGTTQDKTIDLTIRIKKEYQIETMAHLTCVSATREKIKDIVSKLGKNNIENILALRGDIPPGERVEKREFFYAAELVKYIRSVRDEFSIGVAGYHEGHPECKDKKKNIEYLKRKTDQGADFVITQLFFINDHFFRFVDEARRVGIKVPIIPGIMPVTNFKQLSIFAGQCGAEVPLEMERFLIDHQDNPDAIREFGIEYATKQCRDLLKGGCERFHFYTLNRSTSTLKICQNLGLSG